MMMSGSGASSFATACGRAATSRLIEVTTTTVPAGHRQPGGPGQEQLRVQPMVELDFPCEHAAGEARGQQERRERETQPAMDEGEGGATDQSVS